MRSQILKRVFIVTTTIIVSTVVTACGKTSGATLQDNSVSIIEAENSIETETSPQDTNEMQDDKEIEIDTAYINEKEHLILVLNNHQEVDAGRVDNTIASGSDKASVSMYTVFFLDWDGKVLKSTTIEPGVTVEPPKNPSRKGYTFIGWNKEFSNITANTVITAMYEREVTSEPAVCVGDAKVSPGDMQVQIPVSIQNNPGIVGMTLKLTYDETIMTLESVTRGSALSEMSSFTQPKDLSSGCQFPWATEEVQPEDITDGGILILTFSISETAVAGNYDVVISYDEGAIIDNNLNPVSMKIQNGTIVVK